MAFQFESKEFRSLFKKVENICTDIINSPEKYTQENLHLADAINTAGHVLNTNIDLSEYDNLILSTRDMPVFDFVNEITRTLEEYNNNSSGGDLKSLNNLLRHTAVLIYAYFYELNLRIKNLKTNIGMYVGQFKTSIEKIVLVDSPYYTHLNHVKNYLMFSIIQDMLSVSGISKLNDLNNKIIEAKEILESWDEKLKEREKAVTEIESKLKNIKQQYDFVLLNKGFKDLHEKKEAQLDRVINNYNNVSTMLLMIPLVIIISLLVLFLTIGNESLTYLVYFVLPVATFTILLLYFSRVNLQERRALQSQMMQIELRMALCQFIHSYAQDSEELHKKNAAGFDKFENLIFSPIVSSDDNIPSTIDGVDQLVKLIEATKK